MDFKSEKPIYRQIVDYVCDRIASGRWPEQERVPSVRDMAAQLQVNPNTAMRAFVSIASPIRRCRRSRR